jgi:hypothetical protein
VLVYEEQIRSRWGSLHEADADHTKADHHDLLSSPDCHLGEVRHWTETTQMETMDIISSEKTGESRHPAY